MDERQWDVEIGTVFAGYEDEFRVEQKRTCPSGGVINIDYRVSEDPRPGILVIKPGKPTDCDDDPQCQEPPALQGIVSPGRATAPAECDIPLLAEDEIADFFDLGGEETPIVVPPDQDEYNDEGIEYTFDGGGAPGTLFGGECSWICVSAYSIMMVASVAFPAAGLVRYAVAIAARGKLWRLLTQGVGSLVRFNVMGDPHMATLDQLGYDFHVVGEFDLLEVPEHDLRIQARLMPMGRNASVIGAIALELNGHKVELATARPPLIDGGPVEVPDGGHIYLGRGAGIIRDGANYIVLPPGYDERPMFVWGPASLQSYVPDGVATAGLLGNNDKNPDNDLRLRDGTQLARDTSQATLYSILADSWRITDETSLFTYGPGESTATHTDLTFPDAVVTIGDFSDEDRVAAAAICEEAGVVVGPQFDACIFDVVTTGDESFATAAAHVRDDIVHADPAVIDETGGLSVDFEGEVPSNFAASRFATDPELTTFAGPLFSNDSYGFSLAELPAHSAVDTSFELVTIGSWNGDGTNEEIRLAVDDVQVWNASAIDSGDPADPAPVIPALGPPTRTGTTASGEAFAVFEVSAPAIHHAPTARFSVTSTGLSGVTGRSIGIDNVALQVELTPPQIFDLALPATVSQDMPASGAGNLESVWSRDVYRFAVSGNDQSVYLDLACGTFNLLSWTVWDVGDSAVGSGSGCQDETIGPLSAGEYRLEFKPIGAGGGTYGFTMLNVPAADAFNVTLPLTVAEDQPGPGAGAIEFAASKDVYTFVVPEGGNSVYVDVHTCLQTSGGAWQLLTNDGARIASGIGCAGRQIDNLTEGTYRLEYSSTQGLTGAYTLDLFEVPSPHVFDVSLPATISDGVPGAGAGNIETSASVDSYRFTISETQLVNVEHVTCPNGAYGQWTLVSEADHSPLAAATTCRDEEVELQPGTYRVDVAAFQGRTGTYELSIYAVPGADTFDVALPAAVSNGVPGPGAGNIETTASRDIYTFTVPVGGEAIYVDTRTCVGFAYGKWKLTSTGTGHVVVDKPSCVDARVDDLPAGEYQLEFTSPDRTGAYAIDIYQVPDPDTFDVTLPLTVSNGVPAPGAGNIETTASADIYTFTLTAEGEAIYVDTRTCIAFAYGKWKLTNIGTGQTVVDKPSCVDAQIDNLPAGDYQLEFSSPDRSGPYALNLYVVPDPDTFDVTLPLTVSNGVPGPGAGNIETTASRDIYTFATAGQPVTLDMLTCLGGSSGRWALYDNTTNTSIDTATGCTDRTLSNLPAGTYGLEITSTNDLVGTYSLTIKPAAVKNSSIGIGKRIR